MDSKVDEKLDKIENHLGSIDVTLAKQSVILDEHVRRSNLLEAKLQPIERHVAMVSGALKLLGILAVIFEIYKALK